MKKLNHSVLIVSIAAAVAIIGCSLTLGLFKGVAPGLLTGLGAFTLLIACMLFANRHMKKKDRKTKKNKNQNKENQ